MISRACSVVLLGPARVREAFVAHRGNGRDRWSAMRASLLGPHPNSHLEPRRAAADSSSMTEPRGIPG
ncbi:hypothetical protein C8Q73DRAFT_674467 [Cubamyces lactineus]|nr:hypothetical protein C8Q73DRAFT_674467 [Cubamyces lactineus]